jgi:two-component system chemotaxis response regulator CheY
VKLLIVEDSALIRKVTQLAFASSEYDLEEAENGLAALVLVARAVQPFDAIVLDLRMPDMNGAEFLRALRQRPLHAATPVVIASSEGEASELLQEARRLGVTAVLKKPWKPEELTAAVRRACTTPQPEGEGGQA